jgi:hypothetical protein
LKEVAMRWLRLILVLGIVSSSIVFAADGGCNKDLTIEYDFLNSRVRYLSQGEEGRPCVAHRGTATLLIKEINPFLFAVKIDGSSQSFHLELPDIFSSQLKSRTVEIQETKRLDEGLNKFRVTVDTRDAPKWDEALDTFREKLYNAYNPILDVERQAAALIHQSLRLSQTEIRSGLELIVGRELGLDYRQRDHWPAQIRIFGRDRLTAPREAFASLEAAFENLTSDQQKAVQPIFDLAEASYREFLNNEENLRTKYQDLADLVQKLAIATFRISSPPVLADGDVVVFSVEISKNPNLDADIVVPIPSDPVRFEVDVDGGIQVDFSTGFFFSSLTDESFTTVTDDEGETKLARGGSEDAFSVAVGGLAHVYRRSHENFNWGGSFGLGIGNDSSMEYYLGLSALIGRSRRWVVTVGAAGGKVERLGNGLQVGDEYDPATGTIPTEQKFEVGAFLSLSFNFGSGGK